MENILKLYNIYKKFEIKEFIKFSLFNILIINYLILLKSS